MLVFALLAAGILAIGCLYYRNYEQNYRAEVERQLSSIADLKVNELVQYRKERLGDANTFSDNPAFSELVRRFLDPPVDEDARRQLQHGSADFRPTTNIPRSICSMSRALNGWRSPTSRSRCPVIWPGTTPRPCDPAG